MNMTTYEKIQLATGRQPVECSCQDCQDQCKTAPCLGTPEDILKLIQAGHGDKLQAIIWMAGVFTGLNDKPLTMVQLKFMEGEGCIMLKNGLCTLHKSGLKPTEGKLSHHTACFDKVKSIAWNVAKEWCDLDNLETMNEIADAILNPNNENDPY
jgi:hypothetical protein